MIRLAIVPLVLLGTFACGGGSTPAEAPPSAEAAVAAPPAVDVERVATLARRIHADPGAAERLLREAGFDRASFEEALLTIAADPELSAQFLGRSNKTR